MNNCGNCRNLKVTESMIGYAEKIKVDPLRLSYGYCLLLRDFLSKEKSCDKHEKQ